ncbi:MAG: T9SS type A sorting domain-containing protein [Flavobacteriales bacterium]
MLPGIYAVTVLDENLCLATDSVVIGFKNLSPSVYIGNDTSLCNVPEWDLTYTGSAPHVLWSTGKNKPTITVDYTGTYSVRVTDSVGCSSDDTIQLVFNYSNPINLGEDTVICIDTLNAQIIVDAGAGFETYRWSTEDTTESILVTWEDVYWVSASTAENCVSTDTIAIEFDVCIPFLPGCDKASVIAYPNPTNDIVTIELCEWPAFPNVMLLYDAQGRLLETRKSKLRFNDFDLSHHAEGVYILKVLGYSGRETVRIIKL